jgi:hypothetical protein
VGIGSSWTVAGTIGIGLIGVAANMGFVAGVEENHTSPVEGFLRAYRACSRAAIAGYL